jgi:hypothetical protein
LAWTHFWIVPASEVSRFPAASKSSALILSRNCASLSNITFANGLTKIAFAAFQSCQSLKSIQIPGSLTNIGGGAFSDCTNLEAIIVDSANSFYTSKDGTLFNKDQTTIILRPPSSEGTSYTIPASVKNLGDSAFAGCISLTSVTIPVGLTNIGEGAFDSCSNLISVEMPDGLLDIGGLCFWELRPPR